MGLQTPDFLNKKYTGFLKRNYAFFHIKSISHIVQARFEDYNFIVRIIKLYGKCSRILNILKYI